MGRRRLLEFLQVRRNAELVQASAEMERLVAVIQPEPVDLKPDAKTETSQAAEIIHR